MWILAYLVRALAGCSCRAWGARFNPTVHLYKPFFQRFGSSGLTGSLRPNASNLNSVRCDRGVYLADHGGIQYGGLVDVSRRHGATTPHSCPCWHCLCTRLFTASFPAVHTRGEQISLLTVVDRGGGAGVITPPPLQVHKISNWK